MGEHAAYIDRSGFQSGQTDVGTVAQVDLEVADQYEVPHMHLQTDPRLAVGLSSRAENPAGWRLALRYPGAGLKVSAGRNKRRGQASIEGVTADPPGGRGQGKRAERLLAKMIGRRAMRVGIAKNLTQPEPCDGAVARAGNEFAAHAMARIAARLEDCHRNTGSAQRKPQREPGGATADDFDGERAVQKHPYATARIRQCATLS